MSKKKQGSQPVKQDTKKGGKKKKGKKK